MLGKIKKVNEEKAYGFIETGKADYFFHKDDFDGHWNDLIADFFRNIIIEVEFEPTRTEKGLRAAEVRRVDNGRFTE